MSQNFRRLVVSTIHFDDELCWETYEISDVLSYGMLSSEPITLNIVT